MAHRRAFLVDTSVVFRSPTPAIAERLRLLVDDGAVASCTLIDLEVLYSARARNYDVVLEHRRSFPSVPITPDVMERSIEIQQLLARRAHHRVPIGDLIIAAAAESAGVPVLHYDAHYEQIAAVTSQPH